MDAPNDKATEFERRASRRISRISRAASVRTTGDADDADAGDAGLARSLEDTGSNDAYDDYSHAMAAVVSDGFRPSPPGDTGAVGAAAANAHFPDPHMSRPSFSSTASDTFTDGDTPSGSSGLALSKPNSPSSVPSSIVPSTSRTSYSPPPSHTRDLDLQTQSTQPGSALPSSVQQGRSVSDRPASIAKPPSGYTYPPAPGGGSRASRMSGRNSDTASVASSSMPQVQADEPYQGPSGPSFPYQLYPQNVRMARTPSTSTAPSVAPEPDAAYTGPRGPTFPYSMYPQTAMAALNAVPVAGIPVGFSGMPDNYRRRIGPDGEDVADMIGPDGHTEQLPPYSKYPEDTYARKLAATASASQSDPLLDAQMSPASIPGTAAQPNTVPIAIPPAHAEALQPTQPPMPAPPMPAPPVPAHPHALLGAIQPVSGAGGLGLAPRNPEYDGTEDLESPHSRHSLRSFHSDGSSRELNGAAGVFNEKTRRRPNKLKRIGGRRLMDLVPCWAICLLITVLVLLAVILGAVLGSFLAKHKKAGTSRRPLREVYPTAVTVTVDATPIPTPSGLPNLPLGTFNLPLQREAAPAACFNDTTQAAAWSCNMPFMQQLSITIDVSAPISNSAPYTVSFSCNESTTMGNDVFYYGEQPPTFGGPMPLQLVSDAVEPNRGPAWFKMVPYNKTVIVQESLLSATPTAASTATPLHRRGSFQNVERATSYGGSNSFARKQTQMALAGDKPWVCTWPDTVLEVFIYPHQNTSAGPPPFWTAWPTPTTGGALTPPPSTAPPGAPYGTPTTGTPTTPVSPPPGFPTFMGFPPPPMPPPYPRVVKLEERRMGNSPQATCVQYELKQGATGIYAVPNTDAQGNQVQIVISELESGPDLKRSVRRGTNGLEADATSLSQCGCIWMMT